MRLALGGTGGLSASGLTSLKTPLTCSITALWHFFWEGGLLLYLPLEFRQATAARFCCTWRVQCRLWRALQTEPSITTCHPKMSLLGRSLEYRNIPYGGGLIWGLSNIPLPQNHPLAVPFADLSRSFAAQGKPKTASSDDDNKSIDADTHYISLYYPFAGPFAVLSRIFRDHRKALILLLTCSGCI